MFRDDKLRATERMTREEVDAAFEAAADTKFDELGHKTIREVPAFVCRESHATCLKYTVLYDASCIISPV